MADELGINGQQYDELVKRGWRPAEIALAMPSEIANALAEAIPQEPYEIRIRNRLGGNRRG